MATAQHYSARPNVSVADRQHSPILHLKNLNNWVKRVLLNDWRHLRHHVLYHMVWRQHADDDEDDEVMTEFDGAAKN